MFFLDHEAAFMAVTEAKVLDMLLATHIVIPVLCQT